MTAALEKEVAQLRERLSNAECRIVDLLLPEDGHAAKTARRYIAIHRPDLMEVLVRQERGMPPPSKPAPL